MKIALKTLLDHKGFLKYFKNTSWLFIEKILRITVGLFVGVWVARYLGPDQFGLLSYTRSLVGLFSVVATLGLDSIVVRELVKDQTKRDLLLGTVFTLKLVGAIVVLIVLVVAVSLTSNDNFTNILIFIIGSATLFQGFNVIDYYFQSKVLSKFVVYANIISLFISSIIKIYLIVSEASLIAFASVILFDSIILSLGFVYFYTKNNLLIKQWKFDKIIATSLMKDSWPLLLASSILMIQVRFDQIMLKAMVGMKEVGYYSAALRLIEAIGLIPMLINSSLLPSIISAKKYSSKLFRKRITKYYRLNFLLFLVTAAPIILFSEQIIILLFGIEYQSAGILFLLMTTRLFFIYVGIARGVYILTLNLLRFSLITMTLGTIANIILNYIWIEQYGTKGSVYASIVSFFITIFFIDIFYSKTRKNLYLMMKGIFSFHKIKLNPQSED